MAGNIKKHGDSADCALVAVPDNQRMSKGSLTMAWWAICSAMFWLVVSATLAMNFGTQNAIIGLLLSVVSYAAINGVIARYAIKSGLGAPNRADEAVADRPAGRGRLRRLRSGLADAGTGRDGFKYSSGRLPAGRSITADQAVWAVGPGPQKSVPGRHPDALAAPAPAAPEHRLRRS